MGKLAITLALMTLVATSAALDAQDIALGARAGGTGGVFGGNAPRMVPGPVTPTPAPQIPRSQGLSISRPIGTQITGVQTNMPPGFDPAVASPFDARPGTYSRLHRQPFGFNYGYGFPAFAYANESTYDKYFRTPPDPEPTTGTLLLDVTPATAMVFVDSAFVGNVADLQMRGVTLSRGRHWLELEASGYDKKLIEINITVGETLRYRFDMAEERRVAASVIPPRPPQTMYAIPGCYGGNRPPVAANLPPGCDIAKVRVLRPQPATAN